MIYEVRTRLLFTEEDEANDFYHDCEIALAKSTVINPDTEAIEISTLEFINNNHNLDPTEPCILRKSQDNKPI